MTDNDRIRRIREGFAALRRDDSPLARRVREANEHLNHEQPHRGQTEALVELAVGPITYRDDAEQAVAEVEREAELLARAGVPSNTKVTPPAVNSESITVRVQSGSYEATDAARVVDDALRN